MSTRWALTIDLETGRELKLQDFFSQSEDYKKVIVAEIKRQVETEPDLFFPDAVDTAREILEQGEARFYLEYGNLVVYFGEYDIAPYVAGIIEFRIPFEGLVA
jgi:hypothetical protein